MNNGRLSGRVALITGSDSGIGQGTAIEFAREGADVVVNYLHDRSGAGDTIKEVENLGQRALGIQADVTDEQQVEELFNQAISGMGKVDILMNNAGVEASGTEVGDLDTETFDRTIKSDLYSAFFCSRKFIQHRRNEGGRGKIINVTSVHEEVPRVGSADYDCAKGALRNLTRTLSLELAPLKINVNAIAPGMFLTPFNEELVQSEELRERKVQNIPWGRAGEPREVGRLAVFLASDDADYVTGSTYVIDGGMMENFS